jgi:hypothetical protein
MSGVKLSAKWQLDAALLSRPVDLTSLVSLSRSHPDKFTEDNTVHRLVTSLLNETNLNKSDKVCSCLFSRVLYVLFNSLIALNRTPNWTC